MFSRVNFMHVYDHGTHAYFDSFLKITDTFVQHTWNDKIVDFTLFVENLICLLCFIHKLSKKLYSCC